MKKLMALAVAGLMLLSLASCTTDVSGKQEKIQESKKMVVYTDPNFPPFEYMGAGSKIVGVDMEIAKAIAAELGAEADFQPYDFDAIITGIKQGKCDIAISGMTITEERKKNVDFSDPYIKSVQYLILPKDSEIATMEDLAGKTVGVALGYTGQFLMEDETSKDEKEDWEGVLYNKNTTIQEYKSAMEGTLDIGNRIDAVVMDEYVAKNIVSKNDSLKAVELKYANGDLAEEEYGVVVPKGNADLLETINTVIAKLKSDGKIEEWVVQFAEDYTADE